MKKQKGFTLIELLAIIVILAIIAVITVPIILNVIDNAKRGTAKDSAYGYKDAISKYYVSGMLEDESIELSGDYNVVDGKLGEYDIPFSGTKPTSGYLTFENNALTSGCLTIDEYKVSFENGEVTNVEVGECGPKVAYKCKRADVSTLHEEECQFSCQGDGIANGTIMKYGNQITTDGVLISGDAFDCDVDGDGIFSSETERFYYVSDLYDSTIEKEDKYNHDVAVLIYYNNTKNGSPNNTSEGKIIYDVDLLNYNGPITAINNLPKISEWKNVKLYETTRPILNEIGTGTGKNGDENVSYTKTFSYERYAARILSIQEVNFACNITAGTHTQGQLSSCNYLMENIQYSNGSLGTAGYWLENIHQASSSNIWYISGTNRNVTLTTPTTSSIESGSNIYGVRPVIEVLKADIEY